MGNIGRKGRAGQQAHTPTLATLTHTQGAQQLCHNQEQEESKELYMTKDTTCFL